MLSDEQEIRQVVATWLAASKAGDIATILTLPAGYAKGRFRSRIRSSGGSSEASD
jgi:hypothetical protein